MKKIILLLLIFMTFIPVVNSKTCDNHNIIIESITLESKDESVTEVSEATIEGQKIKLDLSMSKTNDNAVYKVVIKNNSNENYDIDKKALKFDSEYIDYSIETEDNSNTIKPKSSKILTLKISYTKDIPEDKYEDGTYFDNKTIVVNLSNEQAYGILSSLTNPKTGFQFILLLISIVLIFGLSVFMILTKRKKAPFIFLIAVMIIIPISVYASCKYEVEIVSKIKIEQPPFTGIIYRNNNNSVMVGDSIRPKTFWIIKDTANITSIDGEYLSKSACEEEIDNNLRLGWVIPESNLYCEKYIKSAGSYALSASELNKRYYIKNEVVNNIITKQQVCFVTDKEVCLNDPGLDSSAYRIESQVLLAETDWFEANGGTCTYYSSYKTECIGAGFDTIYIGFMTGYAYVEGLDHIKCTSTSCLLKK